MPAFDANLMFRTTGDLTASETSNALVIYGTPIRGLAARVNVPQAFGANDTMLAKVYASTDGSSYNLVAQYAKGATKVYGGKDMIIPFALPASKWYVKLELTVTAASTTSNFGAVKAGIVEGVGYDFDRTTHFS